MGLAPGVAYGGREVLGMAQGLPLTPSRLHVGQDQWGWGGAERVGSEDPQCRWGTLSSPGCCFCEAQPWAGWELGLWSTWVCGVAKASSRPWANTGGLLTGQQDAGNHSGAEGDVFLKR